MSICTSNSQHESHYDAVVLFHQCLTVSHYPSKERFLKVARRAVSQESLYVHFGNVWRRFVRLVLIMIKGCVLESRTQNT